VTGVVAMAVEGDVALFLRAVSCRMHMLSLLWSLVPLRALSFHSSLALRPLRACCKFMSSTGASVPAGYHRVPIDTLRDYTLQALQKIGHSYEDAFIITETLMYAELRSNNQGLIKLITGGLPAHPRAGPVTTLFESPVSAKIDGAQRIGMVVVHEAVQMAIQKAHAHGIAIVGCSNYNTATGALGHWAQKITAEGMIGIVMSQCSEVRSCTFHFTLCQMNHE